VLTFTKSPVEIPSALPPLTARIAPPPHVAADPGAVNVTEDDVLDVNPGVSLAVARAAALHAGSLRLDANDAQCTAFGASFVAAAQNELASGHTISSDRLHIAQAYTAAAWTLATTFDGSRAAVFRDRAITLESIVAALEERITEQGD